MPIRPSAFILHCPRCRWQKRVTPPSDVMLPGDVPNRCPKCDNSGLEQKPTSRLFDRLPRR